MFKLSNVLKNAILLIILIQLAPPFFSAIKKQYRTLLEPHTKVGILCIDKPFCQSHPYIQQLKDFFKDKSIKAIVLRIDCSSGYAGSAQALYHELRALKQEYTKPMAVYVENICSSVGYYAASAADFIVATPSACIGGILKNTAEHDKVIDQSLTDDTYRQCIHDIAQARPQLAFATSAMWADGKTFTGNQALELGLVDAVGSPATLEAMLRKKTPIDGEIEWVRAPTNNESGVLITIMQQVAACITNACSSGW